MSKVASNRLTPDNNPVTDCQSKVHSTSISFFSDSFVLRGGKKPLVNLEFVLDLDNEGNRSVLEKDIKNLGGKVLETLDEDKSKPFCIVTDHPHAPYLEKMTKAGKISTDYSNSLPVLLRIAINNGVRVRTYDSCRQIISNVMARVKLNEKAAFAPLKSTTRYVGRGERKLMAPYIKLEPDSQNHSPSWKEYGIPSNFRPIYVGEAAGRSIFHQVSPESKRQKTDVKTQKPRAKSHEGPGFCDICARDCPDIQLHLACKEHQMNISAPGFYDEVDRLCGSFVKEIVVPNKRLRRRSITPEPHPSATDCPDGDALSNPPSPPAVIFKT